MKIGVVNWSDGKIGGAESYLAQVLPALQARGEELAFWAEEGGSPERGSVVPEGVPIWRASEMGRAASIDALARWKPDVLYVNGLTDPSFEAELQKVAPAIFFAHGYYGTCIPGAKTNHFPQIAACEKRFGWACVGYFYPRRCGGLNPLTMVRDFRVQSRRLELLENYAVILCASNHMRNEYLRHGFETDRVRLTPYPIEPSDGSDLGTGPIAPPEPGQPWRILFAGRMEPQKGGDLLLDALPTVASSVQGGIEVIFAGDGRQRPALEAKAAEIRSTGSDVRITFTGWMGEAGLDQLTRTVHLLALPSIWPEPFGMAGVEAGHLGVPAVAFRTGGIPDWLEHGVNGLLAPADPPAVEGLAAAIVGCLDRRVHAGMSVAARAMASRFSLDAHMKSLLATLSAFRKPTSLPTGAEAGVL